MNRQTFDEYFNLVPLFGSYRNDSEIYNIKKLLLDESIRQKALSLIYQLNNEMKQAKNSIEEYYKDTYTLAAKYHKKQKYDRSVTLFTDVINRFRRSAYVETSLYLRGECNMYLNYFEYAVLDFEMYLAISNDYEPDRLSALAHLIQCNNSLNYTEKTKFYINITKHFYEKIRAKYLTRNYSPERMLCAANSFNEAEAAVEYAGKKFNGSYWSLRKPTFHNNHQDFHPYQGYSGNEKIMHASVACSLTEHNGKLKMMANRRIPKNEVVILEKAFIYNLFSPMQQCDICLKTGNNLYPCFDCHMRSYCSSECMKLDEELHQYECKILTSLIVQHLDANILLRFFIKCMIFLRENLFKNSQRTKEIKTAEECLKLIEEYVKTSKTPSRIKNVLNTPVDYSMIEEEFYYYSVVRAFRLGLLISVYSDIPCTLLNFLENLTLHEKEVFVGSFLLRLQFQVNLNSIEYGYCLKQHSSAKFENKIKYLDDLQNKVKQNQYDKFSRIGIFFAAKKKKNKGTEVYQTKKINDSSIVGSFESIRNEPTNGRVSSFQYYKLSMDEVHKNVVNMVAFTTNQNKDNLHNYKILENLYSFPTKLGKSIFEFVNYTVLDKKSETFSKIKSILGFTNISKAYEYTLGLCRTNYADVFDSEYIPQTMIGIYPTLSKLRHSCEPNVIAVLLDSGYVVVKTTRDIKHGEELCISLGPHYKISHKKYRKEFLTKMSRKCECKNCTTNDIEDFVKLNSFNCYVCKNLIENLESECSNCGSSVIDSMNVYNTFSLFMDSIEKKLIMLGFERFLYRHYLTIQKFYELIFPETNYTFFLFKLKMAKFLANKNFVAEAIWEVKNLKTIAEKIHPAMSLKLYDEYKILFNIIMVILENNLGSNEACESECAGTNLEISYIKALQLIQEMIEINDMHLRHDDETMELLLNYQRVKDFKIKVHFYGMEEKEKKFKFSHREFLFLRSSNKVPNLVSFKRNSFNSFESFKELRRNSIGSDETSSNETSLNESDEKNYDFTNITDTELNEQNLKLQKLIEDMTKEWDEKCVVANSLLSLN